MNTHKNLTKLLLVSLLVMPLSAFAQVGMVAHDSISGLSAQVELSGLPEDDTDDTALIVLPPYGEEIVVPIAAEPDGSADIMIPGPQLQEAGRYIVTVEHAGEDLGIQDTFEVLPDSVDALNSNIQADRDMIQPNGQDAVTVSVILRDKYENPLSGRPVRLVSSRSSDAIEEMTSETDSRGEQLFRVSTNEAGQLTLRAVDLISGNVLLSQLTLSAGGSNPFAASLLPTYPVTAQVAQQPTSDLLRRGQRYMPAGGSAFAGNILNDGRKLYGQVSGFGAVDRFILETPREVRVNQDQDLVITAVDSKGNVVEDYQGTVLLSSTDPNAVLPSFGEVTFRGSDLGKKKLVLGLRFSTASNGMDPDYHTLHAEDSDDASVFGEIDVVVQGDGSSNPEGIITIENPYPNSLINTHTITIEGSGPSFTNLIVTGGLQDAFGDTDQDGNFSINVQLNPDLTNHTLRVRDESGRFDSGNLVLTLDQTNPEVESFTFSPSVPKEGEDILAVAKIREEGKLESIFLTIDGQEYPLEPAAGSGTYQVLLSLDQFGTLQPILSVTDAAGNSVETRATLEVVQRGLPQVQNVVASAESNTVSLRWEALKDTEVDAYRIFVGDRPPSADTDFNFTLDTESDVPAAKVAGLQPGTTYYFGIKALFEQRESEEMSDIIELRIHMAALKSTPNDGGVLLQWSELDGGMPLSSYILEYGTDAPNLSETRQINGDLETYTVRNLINDVQYFFRLTPVTTTGQRLNDFAVETQATPDGSGFHPAPPAPLPPGVITNPNPVVPPVQPPPVITHNPPPPDKNLDPTGVPSLHWWILMAIGLAGSYAYLQRRRSLQASQAFLAQMQQQYTQGRPVYYV